MSKPSFDPNRDNGGSYAASALTRIAVAMTLIFGASCASGGATPGTEDSGGRAMDGQAPMDAYAPTDAYVPMDAPARIDAQASADASGDAPSPLDAHGLVDAPTLVDSSRPSDAGSSPCTGTPWGTVPSGFSGTAYRTAHPRTGDTCADVVSETRTCTAGVMSGSFTQTTCTNYACPLEDAGRIGRVQVGVWYRQGTTYRMCQDDGTWGGPVADPNPTATYCLYGAYELPTWACGHYLEDGKTYMCEAPNWVEVTTPGVGCPPGP